MLMPTIVPITIETINTILIIRNVGINSLNVAKYHAKTAYNINLIRST